MLTDKPLAALRQLRRWRRVAGVITAAALIIGAAAAPAVASWPDPGSNTATRHPWLTSIAPNPAGPGYWVQADALLGSGGGTHAYAGAPDYGPISLPGGWITASPSGRGYWVTDQEGHIYTGGDANPTWGSVAAHSGYRPNTSDGGIRNPIAAVAATPSGQGLWALDTQGDVWTLGDAQSYGSPQKKVGNAIAVGLVPTKSGRGYTIVASDGGVFTYGDAQFHGSTGGHQPHGQDVVGIATTADGGGYWMADTSGTITTFGNAEFHGQGGSGTSPYTNIAAFPDGSGYYLIQENATVTAFPGGVAGQGQGFTTPRRATFTVGDADRFSVRAVGATRVTASKRLPRGLRFRYRGDGVATISGTPAVGTAGRWRIRMVAYRHRKVIDRQLLRLTVDPGLGGNGTDAASFTSITANPKGAGYWAQIYGWPTRPGDGAPAYDNIPQWGTIVAAPDGAGYWVIEQDGTILTSGSAHSGWGSVAAHSGYIYETTTPYGNARNPIMAVAATPSGQGLWAVDARGDVWTLGDAPALGAPSDRHAIGSALATGIAGTRSGHGYTIAASDGGVFTYGDAQFHGSTGGHRPNGHDITGMAVTPDGGGYWLVDAGGAVLPFGNASFYGQDQYIGFNGSIAVSAIAARSDGSGYYLIRENGTVNTFLATGRSQHP